MIAQQHQSRKRRHNETTMAATGATASIGSNSRLMVDSPTMLVNSAAVGTSAVQPTSIHNETNRQDVVASTASEIVDHALLSTSAGVVVPSPNMLPGTGNGLSMSIGDSPEQQQQQLQDTQLQQHHHDVTESAAAFAASIALAGVGIGTDGDLNSHHDAAVADSAAVEAAVAAALAATDAKSNSYHHHLSPSALDVNHPDLLEVNHVVHGSNDPLDPPDTTDAPARSAEGGILGLALDAAAKLAAAAATLPSDEAVLAAAAAVTKGEEEGGNDQTDEGVILV